MRETHKGNSFKEGDPWEVCPRCGFDYRRSEMVLEHTGKRVCAKCCDDHPDTKSASAKTNY